MVRWKFWQPKPAPAKPKRTSDELEPYNTQDRRLQLRSSWLLALSTLLVSIALGFIVFFTGRWAYRAITGTDNSQPADNINVTQVQKTPTSSGSSNKQKPPAETSRPATTPVTGDQLPKTGDD